MFGCPWPVFVVLEYENEDTSNPIEWLVEVHMPMILPYPRFTWWNEPTTNSKIFLKIST